MRCRLRTLLGRQQYFLLVVILAIVTTAYVARAQDLGLDQRLIIACHRFDVAGAVAALREGADANARFGNGDSKVFQDSWTLGWPVAAKNWTPLIALASSSKFPDPPRKVEGTIADIVWAREQQQKIALHDLEQRHRDSLTILFILFNHSPSTTFGYILCPFGRPALLISRQVVLESTADRRPTVS